MFGHIIAAVHHVVGHDIDKVEAADDTRDRFLGEGDHVALETRSRSGDEFALGELSADLLKHPRHCHWSGG
ncbi:glycosyl hydrolase family 18 [Colletotrichum scovillei]|uniref:Glycosyl hydrolase family 18 n=1 Tax=Colletotrichum scovillei TaxID=1209932 RepID=A0A9P7QWQ6_9PEZI|nr:glycosyl hydrolase family 18 [Colletotrichum scovillei]KAG7042468.1 glycosyl hydrolase family 18 [Colletotrichum scovillei]KAG7062501.1 glycosyl hydrolase family 18 [Colletotrichum scovillei]